MDRADVRPAVEVRSEIKGVPKKRRLRPHEFRALLYLWACPNRTVSVGLFDQMAIRRKWPGPTGGHLEHLGLIEEVLGENRYRITILGGAAAVTYSEWQRTQAMRVDGETADAEVDGMAWEGLRKKRA